MQLTNGYRSRGVQEDHAGSQAVIIERKKKVGGATLFLSQEDRTELAFYWYCILIASISPSHTERGGGERKKDFRQVFQVKSDILDTQPIYRLQTRKETNRHSVSLKPQRIIKICPMIHPNHDR